MTSGELTDRFGALLDSVALDGYYGPPGTLDEVLALLLEALAARPVEEWDAFAESLTTQRRRVLGRHSLRAPMVALRTGEVRYLESGLLARCCWERELRDWRDDLISLAPYVHVARTLDVDVPPLFDRAAQHAVPALAEVMRTFGRRTDVTLGAFGWRQVETPDGPSFESLHLAGSPTGAVVGERSWEEVNQALARELMEWVRTQRSRWGDTGRRN